MRAANDNPVCPGIQRGNQHLADGRHEFRGLQIQGLHPVCPAGAGQDIHHDLLGVTVYQAGQTPAPGGRFRGENGNPPAF